MAPALISTGRANQWKNADQAPVAAMNQAPIIEPAIEPERPTAMAQLTPVTRTTVGYRVADTKFKPFCAPATQKPIRKITVVSW